MFVMSPNCVHAEIACNDAAISCNIRTVRVTHGFLCRDHYRAQQLSIPAKPRKEQPLWEVYRVANLSDDDYIKHIIAQDRKRIDAGKITRIGFCTREGQFMKVLS